MFHATTLLAYVLHIGGGTIGLLSGTVAAFAQKGGTLHRRAGNVFFVSILVMGATAAYLAVAIPGQQGNLFGAVFTIYLVATAWATVRRKEAGVGRFEIVALLVPLALSGLLLAFLFLGAKSSTERPQGPVLIATYVLTAIATLAAAGDLKVILQRGISGVQRISRHLWRMCTALVFATGSAFTNGLPRLLPGPMHVMPIFFAPMLVPLGLLIFWMIRVRFTNWLKREAVAV